MRRFAMFVTACSLYVGFFLVRIPPYGPFPWKRSSAVYFLFSKAGKFKTSMSRVPYYKLLTKRACLSRTGEYWPSVTLFLYGPRFARSVLPRPRANIPQYCPHQRQHQNCTCKSSSVSPLLGCPLCCSSSGR